MRTIARILVTAFALWLTTIVVGGAHDRGIWVDSFDDTFLGGLFSFVVVTIIITVVNATLGTIVRIVSIPLRIITLGLFGIVINAFLLIVVGWLSDLIGFGLRVESFWWALLGAVVLSIFSSILNGLLRTKRK